MTEDVVLFGDLSPSCMFLDSNRRLRLAWSCSGFLIRILEASFLNLLEAKLHALGGYLELLVLDFEPFGEFSELVVETDHLLGGGFLNVAEFRLRFF